MTDKYTKLIEVDNMGDKAGWREVDEIVSDAIKLAELFTSICADMGCHPVKAMLAARVMVAKPERTMRAMEEVLDPGDPGMGGWPVQDFLTWRDSLDKCLDYYKKLEETEEMVDGARADKIRKSINDQLKGLGDDQ